MAFQTQLDCVVAEFSATSWANEELSIYREAQFKQLLQQWYQRYWLTRVKFGTRVAQ
jgi:hypothetical protein